MRIGLDIDDVLFPWSKHAHLACEQAGITRGRVITQWAFHNDYGCTSEELWEVIFEAYRDGMLLNDPVEGVAAHLSAFREAGHSVHLATARGFEKGPRGVDRWVRDDTVNWLYDHGLEHDSLTFTQDKTMVAVDTFLDDSCANVRALRNFGVNAWLHRQPHNAANNDLPWVSGLDEFRKVFALSQRIV